MHIEFLEINSKINVILMVILSAGIHAERDKTYVYHVLHHFFLATMEMHHQLENIILEVSLSMSYDLIGPLVCVSGNY